MKDIKTLYEFTIPQTVLRTVEEETEDGVLTKKEEAIVEVPICIKKPTRRDLEEIDMHYATYLSECMKRGIYTKTMIAKSYANMGGALSEDEKTKYSSLYERFVNKQLALQSLNFKLADIETKDEEEKIKKDIDENTKEFWNIYNEITEFENEQAQLFDQTAEVIARNKTLLWVTTELTYIKKLDENGSPAKHWEPFFEGADYEAKLDYFDSIVENDDEFSKKVTDRASVIVGFWYTGRASTQEEFDYVSESLHNFESSINKENPDAPKIMDNKKEDGKG